MHLFISHATKDAGRESLALAQALEALGHRCWIAPRDVRPGIPYPRQIVNAVEAAHGLVLLVSRAAGESADVLQEVQLAATNKKTIAPVVMAGAEPGADLRYYVSVRHQIAWTGAAAAARALTATFAVPERSAPPDVPRQPQAPVPRGGVDRAKNWLAPASRGGVIGLIVRLITIVALVVAGSFSLQNWVSSRGLAANPANLEVDGGFYGLANAERAITADSNAAGMELFKADLIAQNREMCARPLRVPAPPTVPDPERQIDDNRRMYDTACQNAGAAATCTKTSQDAAAAITAERRLAICTRYPPRVPSMMQPPQ